MDRRNLTQRANAASRGHHSLSYHVTPHEFISPPAFPGVERAASQGHIGPQTQSVSRAQDMANLSHQGVPILACLFYRFDMYHNIECGTHIITRFSDFLQHCVRCHLEPTKPYCSICWDAFKSEEARDLHFKNCKNKKSRPFFYRDEYDRLKGELMGGESVLRERIRGSVPANCPLWELKLRYMWQEKFSHEPLDSPYRGPLQVEMANEMRRANQQALINVLQAEYGWVPAPERLVGIQDAAYSTAHGGPQLRVGEEPSGGHAKASTGREGGALPIGNDFDGFDIDANFNMDFGQPHLPDLSATTFDGSLFGADPILDPSSFAGDPAPPGPVYFSS